MQLLMALRVFLKGLASLRKILLAWKHPAIYLFFTLSFDVLLCLDSIAAYPSEDETSSELESGPIPHERYMLQIITCIFIWLLFSYLYIQHKGNMWTC